MQTPKSLKPIYVNDPNDPRLKAYNDSLTSYKTGKSVAKELEVLFNKQGSNYKKNFTGFYDDSKLKPEYGNKKKGYSPKGYGEKLIKDAKKKTGSSYQLESGKIIKKLDKLKVKPEYTVSQAELPDLSVYKKPVQQVIYDKTKTEDMKKYAALKGAMNGGPGDEERKKKAQEEHKIRSAKVEEMKNAGQISDKQYKYLTTKNNELLELNSTNIDDDKFLERRKSFKEKYKESPGCSGYNCPPDKDLPDERKIETLPIKRVSAITQQAREKIEVPEGPKYSQPNYTKKGTVVQVEKGKTRSYKTGDIFHRKHNKGYKWHSYNLPKVEVYKGVEKKKLIPSIVQKVTGYDKKKMEGYENEEGVRVPGEIERAQNEDRQIKFTGASSIKDLIAQRKYNKQYPEWDKKTKSARLYNAMLANKE
jgi:hypothetical protein